MDLVVRNARIWTADPARPWATALAVRGGRIAAVGDDARGRRRPPVRRRSTPAASS